jgi:predicted dehydrogenase
MAEKYGGKVFESAEALIAGDQDAVSVCVANVYHADLTVKALKAGKHVLCEKPMATTLEECEAMVKAARESGRRLMIGHNQRYAPAHQKAKALIESGEIGRVLTFMTTFGHSGPEIWTGTANSWFFDKNRAAFGALADLGIHKADLIHYLTGDEIVESFAMLGTLDKKTPDGAPVSVDDNALCLMRLKSGGMGVLRASWTNYGREDNSTRIYGTKGVLRVVRRSAPVADFGKADGTVEKFALDPITTNEEQTAGKRRSTGVIDAFVESILTGRPSLAEGTEAVKAMRAVFAAARSAETGCAVRVDA